MPAAAATIPAWAIVASIGAKGLGDYLGMKGATKNADKDRARRNREFIQNLALKNRELDMMDQQFRNKARMEENRQKIGNPMEMMSMIQNLGALGRKPSTTADITAGLLS